MWSSFPKTEPGTLLQQWKPVAVLSLSLPSGLTVGDTVTQFGLRAQNKAATPLLIETLLIQPNLLLESVFMRGTESGALRASTRLWSLHVYYRADLIKLILRTDDTSVPVSTEKMDSLQELLGGTILSHLDSQVQKWLKVLSCRWHYSTRNLTNLYFALL